MQPGKTLKQWTPLHCASWGSIKPQNDKDIVEILLLAAQKGGKAKEDAIRAATECAPVPVCRYLAPWSTRFRLTLTRAPSHALARAVPRASHRSTWPSSGAMRLRLRPRQEATPRRVARQSRKRNDLTRSLIGSRRACRQAERRRKCATPLGVPLLSSVMASPCAPRRPRLCRP